MGFKIKKKKKSKNWRGRNTHGHGARKKWKGSGHHGGVGMAGTGKRADHKKSLIIKLYGNDYFGKQGVTSRGTKKKREKVINLRDIQKNLDSIIKKHGKELKLDDYKILGEGELTSALKIRAKAFSESAKSKIESAGGEAIVIESSKEKSEDKEVKEKKEAKVKTKKAK